MGFMDDFTETVEATAKTIGKKATEIAEKSKNAVELTAIKSKLEKEYAILGKLIFKDATLKDVLCGDARYGAVMKRIEDLLSSMNEIGGNEVKCECGKILEKDAAFCSKCGKKL